MSLAFLVLMHARFEVSRLLSVAIQRLMFGDLDGGSWYLEIRSSEGNGPGGLDKEKLHLCESVFRGGRHG